MRHVMLCIVVGTILGFSILLSSPASAGKGREPAQGPEGPSAPVSCDYPPTRNPQESKEEFKSRLKDWKTECDVEDEDR